MLDAAGQPSEPDDMARFKTDVVSALAPLCSGVLLDAEYGVPALQASGGLPDGVGLLIAADPPEKAEFDGEHRTVVDPSRNAAWVRGQGGDALKYLVQWEPDRPAGDGPDLAEEARVAVREIVDDCRRTGLPAVIEPLVVFGPTVQDPTPQQHVEAVIRSAARLAQTRPDLLKLEWPGGPAGCAEVTTALGPVPWALLSAGVSYEDFLERARIALDAGASGVIAGRSLWGEAVRLSGEERRTFLREVSVPRLRGLVEVLAEHGRSWKETAR
jgi:tagatose-1,6-bisphosphate aldolase